MTPPDPHPCPVRGKFAAARDALRASLVERDDEVDLCLTALAAGEHLLLVGPPGLGKSALLDGLLACAGGRKFSALMTRFTQPEELFGPLSLANPPGMRVTQLLLEVEGVVAATDARNLAEAAKAAAKLGEIERQLSGLSGDRAGKARAYLKDQLRRLKLASLEAV